MLAQRLHDRRTDREVGHVVAVHAVDVQEVGDRRAPARRRPRARAKSADRIDGASFILVTHGDARAAAFRVRAQRHAASERGEARTNMPSVPAACGRRSAPRPCGATGRPGGGSGDEAGQVLGGPRRRRRASRLAGERAHRVDEHAARAHQRRGGGEQLALQRGELVDRRPAAAASGRRAGGAARRGRCTARRGAPGRTCAARSGTARAVGRRPGTRCGSPMRWRAPSIMRTRPASTSSATTSAVGADPLGDRGRLAAGRGGDDRATRSPGSRRRARRRPPGSPGPAASRGRRAPPAGGRGRRRRATISASAHERARLDLGARGAASSVASASAVDLARIRAAA